MPLEPTAMHQPGPGRPGLSFETYEQAYQALTTPDGAPPSQRQLRKYLGTGNNNTLAKYRRRITEEQVSDGKPLETGSLDAELLATVQRLATQIALDEAQVADDRVDEIRKESEQRVRIAEATMEKRLQDTALLEHRATTAESELTKLRKSMEAADLESNDLKAALRKEIQALKEQNAALVQSRSDANDTITTHVQELARRQQIIDKAATDEKAAEKTSQARQTALQIELAESKQANATISEKHASLKTRFEDQVGQIEKQNKQYEALQSRVEQAAEKIEQTSVQLNIAKAANSELELQVAEISGKLNAEKRIHQTVIENSDRALADKTLLIDELRSALGKITKGK